MPVERPWGELLVRADPELVPLVATAANIDSLHRMTRDERDLHGLIANGSDHLTAYNVYAEAVNQHGYLGEVYGLPRHLFEEGLTEWAEKRGVLVKSVEDTALGVAAVYRALELPLPKTMPVRQQGAADAVRRARRPCDALRPGDRRAHGGRHRGADLQDLDGGELGSGRRESALLR